VWVREGQRLNEPSIDIAEDSGVAVHAEGEGENGDGRETRTLSEHAETEAKVLNKSFEERQAALVAVKGFGLLEAAECAAGGEACFFRRHAAADVCFGQRIKMSAQVGVDVRITLAIRGTD